MDEEVNDGRLVMRCRAGEQQAFGDLVDRHRHRLRRLFAATFGDPAEVEDLLQDSFVQAYLNLDRLREPDRFGSWLYGIALNLIRMRLRLRGRTAISRETVEAPDGRAPLVSVSRMPEELTEQRELGHKIRRAIRNLPAAEREATWQVYLLGLSHQETAEALGITAGAVKVRVHRGRRRLQATLRNHDLANRRPATQEVKMVEVTIHDVLVQQVADVSQGLGGDAQLYQAYAATLPEDRLETLRQALEAAAYRVVLLKEKEGERALPIWIGPLEGNDIASQLAGRATKRPLTADLATTLLGLGGVRVERAVISRLHETVFYATLRATSEANGQMHEIDCRPSDALSLAVRLGTPVYVAGEVMGQASERQGADSRYHPSWPERGEVDIAWRSLIE